MYKIIIENQLFGIVNGKRNHVVPCLHFTKEAAIEEWEHFETINVNNQFLDHKLTLEEIQTIKEQLTSQQVI